MALQAKSLAIAVGATETEIEPLVAQLVQAKHLNTATATAFLAQLRHNNE
jgi:hydroxymethylglutaryl-CoA reductase